MDFSIFEVPLFLGILAKTRFAWFAKFKVRLLELVGFDGRFIVLAMLGRRF